MRAMLPSSSQELTEIRGHSLSVGDKIVPTPKFGAVCRLLWPFKTAANIAAIAGRDERTAKRWLAGEFEPPLIVVLAVVAKMFERQ